MNVPYISNQTFFVDIDLSPFNPDTKPDISAVPRPLTPAKRSIDGSTVQPLDSDESSPSAATPLQELENTPSLAAASRQNPYLTSSSRVQILDLNSANPIISYQGKVFSCTWNDTVGTTMFFTHPGESNPVDNLRSTNDYDLIALSRIKLAGQGAKVTVKRPSREVAQNRHTGNEQASDNSVASEPLDSGSHNKAKQASFLQKLMEAKQRLGETDVTRTYIDAKIASADLATIHRSHRDEIQALNDKIVRGDMDALARLQEIYSQSDEKGSNLQESVQRAKEPTPPNKV